ncbi:MAG TPA: hypothetical protein VHM91_09765 [Verrucomicrobiales bacterium]|jgi:hypothetical protein|nr:hypothetical protein [Verrucomicrobiales bacterium]
MLPRLIPLLLVFWLCQIFPARGDINKDRKIKGPAGSPAIESMTVHAVRGIPLVIELKGKTAQGAITFKITQEPTLGKVEGVKQKDNLTGTVVYTASPDKTGETDVFTYNAQGNGTPASEPERVTIRISDAAPRLDVQEVADAGRVVMGHPKEVTFKIRNGGNGAWIAHPSAPKGWRWLKPENGNFELAAGASIECRIQCDALTATTLDETLTLPGGKKLRFRANIVSPFTAPVQYTLKWNAETLERTGILEVQNLDREAPVTVKATAPEWLTLTNDQLTVEPDGKASLPVSIKGEFSKSFNGSLKLSSGEANQEVQIKAAPAPAILRVVSGATPAGEVTFGLLDAETIKTEKRSIMVRNEGGSPALLVPGALKNFTLDTKVPPKGFPLGPGEEVALVVLPPMTTAGTNLETFTLTGVEPPIDLQLKAEVPNSAIALTAGTRAGNALGGIPSPIARPMTRAEMDKRVTNGRDGYFPPDGHEDATVPRINIVEPQIENDNQAVTFVWDLPKGEGWKFQLYFATVERVKAGGMAKIWIPCGDEVKYTIKGGKGMATVSGLRPGVWRKFCLKTIAADGRSSLPGKDFGFQMSERAPNHFQEYWEWYVVALFGGSGLFYWLRKKWREPISAVAA